MDIYSLVATSISPGARAGRMNAKAEDRYYSDYVGLPPVNPGLLGSIAVTACIVLILVGITPA